MSQGTAGGTPWPSRIGRYQIIRPLSKGGMALVFLARQETPEGVSPLVALKVILPDYAKSETFNALFENEAKLGAEMRHQNLVSIIRFEQDEGRNFLVMEYVEGLTLSRFIGVASRHNLRVPLPVVCEIGRQACEGLYYAHEATDPLGRPVGLVHRDIKPSNLILNREGTLKILDFGISKAALRAERLGSVKGTWGYMAPEQAMGERVGPTSDLFGLAIVLYEMASRRTMFKGRDEAETRRLLADDHAARLAATLDAHYAPLVKVLIRALQRDPSARFGSASDMARALADLLPNPVQAREETVRFLRQVMQLEEAERAQQAAAVGAASPAGPAPARAAASQATEMESDAGSTGGLAPLREGRGVAARVSDVRPSTWLAFGLFAASVALMAFTLWRLPSQGDAALLARDGGGIDELRPVPVESPRPAPRSPLVAAEAQDAVAVEEEVVVRGPALPGQEPAHDAVVEGPAVVASATHLVEGPGRADEGVRGAVGGGLPPLSLPGIASAVSDEVDPDAPTLIMLRSLQPATIYLDGELVRTEGAAIAVEPGKHTVGFVAPDGRQATMDVEVKAHKTQRLTWDFEVWKRR